MPRFSNHAIRYVLKIILFQRTCSSGFKDVSIAAYFREHFRKGITSCAFPMLDCGNDELDWDKQVRSLMEKYLRPIPVNVLIYLYRHDPFAPEHRDVKRIKEWLKGEPESLPFTEVWEDLDYLKPSIMGRDYATVHDHIRLILTPLESKVMPKGIARVLPIGACEFLFGLI